MNDPTRSPLPPGATDSEHADVLKEVLDDQARRTAARAVSADASQSPFFLQVAVLVLGTFFFYLLFFSPAWITPTAAPPVSAAQIDDGMRVSIFITARQVEAFRVDRGRLPANLAEAGGDDLGLVYQRLDDDTFRIEATTGESSIAYVSTTPLSEFVGDALDILGGLS